MTFGGERQLAENLPAVACEASSDEASLLQSDIEVQRPPRPAEMGGSHRSCSHAHPLCLDLLVDWIPKLVNGRAKAIFSMCLQEPLYFVCCASLHTFGQRANS